MSNRAARFVLLASLLAVPAGAFAATPCDVLPPSVGPALCQACPGPPVPGGRIAGVGLDYVDQWHAQCELYAINKQGQSGGTGKCKSETTCLPGWEKFQDGGVWKCRQPATGQMHENCEKKLPLSIAEVQNDQGLADPTVYPSHAYLFVKGTGAANATSGEMTGGINVTVGEAARRLGNNAVCLPPDCQVVKLEISQAATGARQKLTLFTPHRYRSASASLFVSNPPTPGSSVAGRAGVSGVRVGGPVASPPQPRDQSYSAGLGCPGGQTSWTNVSQTAASSPVFEVKSAQVQATASALSHNTQSSQGTPVCVWEDAFQFRIRALDGQGDVTVSWTPQHSGNYFSPLTLSTSQPVTLAKGRWQIVPDATFPPDFTYSVAFRE